jgi:hypothetical protein
LAAASTATDGEVLLTWNSAGDDGMNGNVTGTYRIQYATYTASWSTSSTPDKRHNGYDATTTQVPGSAQSKLITGLTGGLTYYFVLWTGDEVPNWSTISNSTSAVPTLTVDVVSPSTSTLNGHERKSGRSGVDLVQRGRRRINRQPDRKLSNPIRDVFGHVGHRFNPHQRAQR